jgi:hypothetical protein
MKKKKKSKEKKGTKEVKYLDNMPKEEFASLLKATNVKFNYD